MVDASKRWWISAMLAAAFSIAVATSCTSPADSSAAAATTPRLLAASGTPSSTADAPAPGTLVLVHDVAGVAAARLGIGPYPPVDPAETEAVGPDGLESAFAEFGQEVSLPLPPDNYGVGLFNAAGESIGGPIVVDVVAGQTARVAASELIDVAQAGQPPASASPPAAPPVPPAPGPTRAEPAGGVAVVFSHDLPGERRLQLKAGPYPGTRSPAPAGAAGPDGVVTSSIIGPGQQAVFTLTAGTWGVGAFDETGAPVGEPIVLEITDDGGDETVRASDLVR